MTDKEKEVLGRLTAAHNLFAEINEEDPKASHPADMREWSHKLHDLQRIVMCREVVRNNQEDFNHL